MSNNFSMNGKRRAVQTQRDHTPVISMREKKRNRTPLATDTLQISKTYDSSSNVKKSRQYTSLIEMNKPIQKREVRPMRTHREKRSE